MALRAAEKGSFVTPFFMAKVYGSIDLLVLATVPFV